MRPDPVRLALWFGLLAALSAPLLSFAPNRLFGATGQHWWQLYAWPSLGVLLTLLGLALWGCWRARAAVGAAFALGIVAVGAAGLGAQHLMATAPPAAAVTLASGFWLLLSYALLVLIDAYSRRNAARLAVLLLAALFVAIALWLVLGFGDALSLLRVYHQQAGKFWAALGQHLALVGLALLPVCLFGLPLGWALAQMSRGRAAVLAALNVVQTIPSLALFALLMAPLSALAARFPVLAQLGVAGIGVAPAVIALFLYTLLPLVRNTEAAFRNLPPDVCETARAMGLTRTQIFWQVEVPLAAPVVLSGLRVVVVQAIGLAVIAGLIGAGGLGVFVWQGLGQYAMDTVLLGALPVMLLALLADALMAAAVRYSGRWRFYD